MCVHSTARGFGCAEAHEPAEAYRRIGDPAGNLIEQQVIDLADVLAARVVNLRAFHILAREELRVWMLRCGCHCRCPLQASEAIAGRSAEVCVCGDARTRVGLTAWRTRTS